MKYDLIEWANEITGEEKQEGIIFSDAMNDKLASLDEEIKDVEDLDKELEFNIRYWKMNRSPEALVKIMAISYRYLIGTMIKNKEQWSHLSPDEALMAAFKALPYSVSVYTPGRSKFLSFWAKGVEMAWERIKGV